MNIAVLTASGKTIVRPDTTRSKLDEDIYLPEDVSCIEWSPVLFAKMSRPGKCIAAKFARRYYEGIGFGVLLYPSDYIDGSAEGYAQASCLDHTSILPLPAYNVVTLGRPGNHFLLKKDEQVLFDWNASTAEDSDSAIEKVSQRVLLRMGDMVALELQPREILCRRGEPGPRLSATWCENEIFNSSIIL